MAAVTLSPGAAAKAATNLSSPGEQKY